MGHGVLGPGNCLSLAPVLILQLRQHRGMQRTHPLHPHPASQHTREAQDFTAGTNVPGLLPMVHLTLSPATYRALLSGCITLSYDLFQVGCMKQMSNPKYF